MIDVARALVDPLEKDDIGMRATHLWRRTTLALHLPLPHLGDSNSSSARAVQCRLAALRLGTVVDCNQLLTSMSRGNRARHCTQHPPELLFVASGVVPATLEGVKSLCWAPP